MAHMKSALGQTFGQMTVIEEPPKPPKGNRRVIAQCTCGSIKEVILGDLRSGRTQSCGCLHKALVGSHGHSCENSRQYRIWNNMKQRCNNPNAGKYPIYGGRGITVCDEWAASFESFKAWADTNGYSDALSIDRIDNDKGYYPANCRWTSKGIQSRNKRPTGKGGTDYIGVSWDSTLNRWRAHITVDTSTKYLGLYDTDVDAAQARDRYIREHGLIGYVMNIIA